MVKTMTFVGAARSTGLAVARTGKFNRTWMLGLAALVLTASALHSPALSSNVERSAFCNGIRVQDEIILVNVRSLCGSCDAESMRSGMRLEAYQVRDESGRRQWRSYDLESLLAADPTVPTVIFVHGNQISSGQDRQEGLAVYRRLVNCGGDSGAIRYVIFSWPSTKIRGPLNDYRTKAARTRPVGCQFAWLVNQLPAETPLTLIGYSYGARVITGGLHILAGGTLSGLGLEEPLKTEQRQVNAVLIAAALHANWLGPNQYHGMAMSQVDRMLLLNNRQDLAMRYYHLTTRQGRPQALGLRGPTCIDSEGSAKITERDLACYDGPRHDLFRYLSAPGVLSQIWDLAVVNAEASSDTN